jgi:hypothetical protein
MSDAEWGLYPWFEEHGRNLIHPDDYEAVKALMPYCKVFQSIGFEGEYLKLRYGSQIFRLIPKLFSPIQAPAKEFGEVVRVKKGTELIPAAICDIMWHYGERRPYFYVAAADKCLKKRYWTEDFIEPSN